MKKKGFAFNLDVAEEPILFDENKKFYIKLNKITINGNGIEIKRSSYKFEYVFDINTKTRPLCLELLDNSCDIASKIVGMDSVNRINIRLSIEVEQKKESSC